ncbi:hypothetical protein [Anabaenopsis arnoldii]|uniref:Uncharacterized protein n=1 Tax=Anabaenopsis arnoldii TaxID=2152938 RepID=A0ABT5AMY3_9CYAN|nr:hypothetical protein [Anabaenopsis arnoldii]MDB9538254.1 hypothetical protein [Anabaenopsis arnoldii]MDH6090307.1 hypothetical protein [Anabaenopsis arnoldii]
MVNITIQNLEVESTALNQVSPGEMEKVVGGWTYIGAIQAITNAELFRFVVGVMGDMFQEIVQPPTPCHNGYNNYNNYNGYNGHNGYNGYNG